MRINKLETRGTYVSPECESIVFNAQQVICGSPQFGDFGEPGGPIDNFGGDGDGFDF